MIIHYCTQYEKHIRRLSNRFPYIPYYSLYLCNGFHKQQGEALSKRKKYLNSSNKNDKDNIQENI